MPLTYPPARQHRSLHKVWDVRWPSSDNQDRIIYELNGELQVLDTKGRRSSAISINVPDDGLARRPSRVSPQARSSQLDLAPKAGAPLLSAGRHLQCPD